MTRSPLERFNLKHAFGLSALVHALIAPLFALTGLAILGAGVTLNPMGTHDEERISFATISFARHVVASAVAAIRPAVTVTQPQARPASARIERPAPHARLAQSRNPHSGGATAKARTAIVAPAVVTPERPKPDEVVAQAAESVPSVAPAPLPQPAAAVALALPPPSKISNEVPIGGWGQNFQRPLVADDAALGDLRAKYHFGTITISVDEDGHATKINFPPNVPDDARAELEKRLTAIKYIPAECNGLHCAALLSITL